MLRASGGLEGSPKPVEREAYPSERRPPRTTMRPFSLLLLPFPLPTNPLPTTNPLLALASASPTPAWPSTPPGTVLKIRTAPLLNRTTGNALTAYQILYRTTDSQHDASWAVTMLLVPVRQARCSPTTTPLCVHATLDGVRAVMQVATAFGLRMAAAKVALWWGAGERVGGRAGGGVCAQAGVALGGLAPNVTSVTDYINGGECAGLVPAGT